MKMQLLGQLMELMLGQLITELESSIVPMFVGFCYQMRCGQIKMYPIDWTV